MKIEVDAPEPHQVLIVASDGTRWAAAAIDRAHVGGNDWGPFTAALRYADAHLADAGEPRTGTWAQDAAGTPTTLKAGSRVEVTDPA